MNINKIQKTIYIPKEVLRNIDDYKNANYIVITKYHRSGDIVIEINKKYILKISQNKELLKKEKKTNDFLYGKINVSETISYFENEQYGYYLKSRVKGKPLCSEDYIKKPLLVVELLTNAINLFHTVKDDIGNTLIHGDFCLPNILIYRNKVSGFIDLGDSCFDDPWIDYAWALWSLEYNLQTNYYNEIFLNKLNIKFDEEKYKKYIPY